MIVMKFGGTSVGSAENIKQVCKIIKSKINENPVVVTSAVGGITDKLIEAANAAKKGSAKEILKFIENKHIEILNKLGLDKNLVDEDLESLTNVINSIENTGKTDKKIMDVVQSHGERMSSKILAAYLRSLDVESKAFNAWDIGFITNSDFGNSEPLDTTHEKLRKNILGIKELPIITGFIGKDENGEITTLGRGGSDYTAALIGSCLDSEEIQVWTDVDGMMSADPRIVDDSIILEKVSFKEASELAFFGAKVLHPKTILPAMKKGIPVRILNTFSPEGNGTLILNHAEKIKQVVKGIAFRKNIILVSLDSTRMLGAYGYLAKIFDIFDKYQKSVDVISTSEVNVSLTLNDDENLDEIMKELKDFANVQVFRDKAIICVVGEGLKHTPGVAGKTFSALGRCEINVEMISQAASEINITFIVKNEQADAAVRCLNKEFHGGEKCKN